MNRIRDKRVNREAKQRDAILLSTSWAPPGRRTTVPRGRQEVEHRQPTTVPGAHSSRRLAWLRKPEGNTSSTILTGVLRGCWAVRWPLCVHCCYLFRDQGHSKLLSNSWWPGQRALWGFFLLPSPPQYLPLEDNYKQLWNARGSSEQSWGGNRICLYPIPRGSSFIPFDTTSPECPFLDFYTKGDSISSD